MKDHYSVFFWPGTAVHTADHFCKLPPVVSGTNRFDAKIECNECHRKYGSVNSTRGHDRDWIYYEDQEDGSIILKPPDLHVPFDAYHGNDVTPLQPGTIFDDIGNFADVFK